MTIMKKNYYIAPAIRITTCEEELMGAGSSFGDPGESTQTLTPTDEEYSGEFTSRSGGGLWDDEF